jgi:MFS family permease
VTSPVFGALRSGGFRRLFIAQTVSRWGDTFNYVAIVILVFRLTGSGLKVGATVIFEVAPVLLFGFIAGVVVDRLPRRRVMIAADLGRAAIAVVLVLFHDQLLVIYAAAFGLSAFSVFFNPAASSSLPALVDRKELVGANSAIWSAAVISQIVLAPLAGALITFAGPGPAFAINALTFIVSGTLLFGLRLPARPAPVDRKRLQDAVAGIRLIREARLLRVLASVQGLAALSAGATSALLVVLAERHLDVGAARFGILLSAIGIGAGLGPLVLQKVIADVRRPMLIFGPYLLRGVVDLVLAASASFGVALGALALYGVGTSTGNVTYNTLLQTAVPDEFRGRVFAFFDLVWQSARIISIGAGGLLADAIGIRAVYLFGGLLLVAAGALGLGATSAEDLTHDIGPHPTPGSNS